MMFDALGVQMWFGFLPLALTPYSYFKVHHAYSNCDRRHNLQLRCKSWGYKLKPPSKTWKAKPPA